MALTKITGQVVDTTTDLVVGVTTVGGGVSAVDGFFSGIVTFSNSVSVAGTLTYEDVTNVDSVGLITARNGIVVGSGITLSKDGDGFYTGVVTATTFSGAFSGDGSALTGVANTDVIFSDKITFPDSAAGSINVGLSSDLQIYHDSNHSRIVDSGTGDLKIQSSRVAIDNAAGDETIALFTEGAGVTLYHADSQKLATSSGGVTVTGTVAATSYTGDGSSLTGIEVGITTESASISGITTYLDLSKDDHELVVTGTNTISVIGGSQGDSHTLRLTNSGIATVNFDSYFLFPSGGLPNIPTASGTISLISFTVHRAGAVGVNTQLLAGASVSFA